METQGTMPTKKPRPGRRPRPPQAQASPPAPAPAPAAAETQVEKDLRAAVLAAIAAGETRYAIAKRAFPGHSSMNSQIGRFLDGDRPTIARAAALAAAVGGRIIFEPAPKPRRRKDP